MKTKITKIFLLTLTLAMVIGMAVGFTASAEGDAAAESVAIVSQKIDYAGTTHLYFAVKYENVQNPDKIALNVSYVDSDGATKEVTITESEEVILQDSQGNDVVCRAFKTPGVDAKSFTHKFTATAVTESGTESAAKTYSVTEYCYEWLTYIAAQAEPTADQLKIKEACEATLAYGTKIQALLGIYPEDNTNDYPENYVYVKGTDGVKVNGANSVCVINGTEVALTYEGTETRIGWEVADLAGTEITTADDKFTATASCIAGPELTDAKGEYFLAKQAGTVSGKTWDYDVLTEIDSGNINYSGSTGYFEIADGALHFEDGDAESEQMIAKYWISAPTSYNATVFEFDFKLDSAWSSYPIQIKIANNTHTIYYPKIDNTNKLAMTVNGVQTALGTPIGEWSTIRFEHYYDQAVLKVFVNNEFVFDIATSAGSKGQTPMIYLTSLERGKESNADLWIDNIYVGHLDLDYVAGDPNATPAE